MFYNPSSSSLTAQTLQTASHHSMRVATSARSLEGSSASSSSYGVSGFLLWLRLWMAHTARGILTDIGRAKSKPQSRGYQRPRSLLPDAARSAAAPRILLSRRSKRILARGLPASRRYFGFEHLNARQLTGNQFLERAARLSVSGRTIVYRLEYKARLCVRRPNNGPQKPQAHIPKTEGINLGLCDAHLYPN